MSKKTDNVPVNDICPWSGKPVRQDAVIEYNGKHVGFCSKEHSDHFKRAVDHFQEHIATKYKKE